MNKSNLRHNLFSKYFDEENSILVIDLLDKLRFIKETWNELHSLCNENIKGFRKYNTLEQCKIFVYKKKEYLVLEISFKQFVIIDLHTMDNIKEEEFNDIINQLVENEDYIIMCERLEYIGDVNAFVKFCIDNYNVLSLSTRLKCVFSIGNAITTFQVNFVTGNSILSFITEDQYLYENLFFGYDLNPFSLQDAKEKMGIDEMNFIFSKIKDIRIPKNSIPSDLYSEYEKSYEKNIGNKK